MSVITIKVNDLEIEYRPKTYTILAVRSGRQEIRPIMHELLKELSIQFDPSRPEICSISFPEKINNIALKIFQAIKILSLRDENGCLCAFLANYFFETFTKTWDTLLRKGRFIFTTKYWQHILSFAWEWESRLDGCRVHKGSPYAFLAYSYLLYGDVDTGFVYLYNAIKDDIELNKKCSQLKYPEEAPVYKTICLMDDRQNVLYPLVSEIRESLQSYINTYNSEFGKRLNISSIDTKFLRNDSLKEIKYYFVYTFWKMYEIMFKIRKELVNNDFSKLQHLNLFFNLCIILDKLFQENPKYGQDKLGNNVTKICHDKGWLKQIDNENFRRTIGFDGDLDVIIPKLLSNQTLTNGSPITKEAQFLLIAWRLRNFGGHKITTQNVLVDKFDELCNIVIICIILAIEEL